MTKRKKLFLFLFLVTTMVISFLIQSNQESKEPKPIEKGLFVLEREEEETPLITEKEIALIEKSLKTFDESKDQPVTEDSKTESKDQPVTEDSKEFFQKGVASWYGPGFHGRTTANGETYNMYDLTAAHKELPFGTIVEVTHLRSGRSVTARINDRGPFIRGRVIDLSKQAAEEIGLKDEGLAEVKIEIIEIIESP